MSSNVWIAALSFGVALHAGAVAAQGVVQEHRPHRALSLAESDPGEERCELWRGEIHGNDPSAEITVQLCTREGRVRGTFLWSSRESGWDRRSLEGEWREGATLLVARDTAMLDVHPLHGWTLCTADAYSLRRVSPDRLEGTYASERCRDRGNLVMVRRDDHSKGGAHQERAAATRAARVVEANLAHAAHHSVSRCSATPGAPRAPGAWFFVLGAVGALCARRRRA